MLARKNRFHRRRHIQYAFVHGRTWRHQHLGIRVLRGQRHNGFRAAVVISRKVSKFSTKRNRLRRRLYEIIRKNQARIDPSCDLVMIVYNLELMSMTAGQLEQVVLSLLDRAGVLGLVSSK